MARVWDGWNDAGLKPQQLTGFNNQGLQLLKSTWSMSLSRKFKILSLQEKLKT